jgi:hypothetical protein
MPWQNFSIMLTGMHSEEIRLIAFTGISLESGTEYPASTGKAACYLFFWQLFLVGSQFLLSAE